MDSSLPVKSQTAAALWCAFLGGVGAHRFYLGRVRSGLVYLLFCWTGIPMLVSFGEMFSIAWMTPDRWAEKFNGGRPGPGVGGWVKCLAVVVVVLFWLALYASVLYAQRKT